MKYDFYSEGPKGKIKKQIAFNMKKAEKKLSGLAKQAAKIKVSKRLDSIEDAPFFKKKMEKGAKILAVAGLPKR